LIRSFAVTLVGWIVSFLVAVQLWRSHVMSIEIGMLRRHLYQSVVNKLYSRFDYVVWSVVWVT
jgi:hypothetical protein